MEINNAIEQSLLEQYEKITSVSEAIQFAYDFTQQYLRQIEVSKQSSDLIRTVNKDDPDAIRSVKLLNEVIIPQLPELLTTIFCKNPSILLASSLSAYAASEVFTIISNLDQSKEILSESYDMRGSYNKYAQFAFSPIDKIRGKVKDVLIVPEFKADPSNILEVANIVSGGLFKDPTKCEGSDTHRKFASLFWTSLFYVAHAKGIIDLRKLNITYEANKGCWPFVK